MTLSSELKTLNYYDCFKCEEPVDPTNKKDEEVFVPPVTDIPEEPTD